MAKNVQKRVQLNRISYFFTLYSASSEQVYLQVVASLVVRIFYLIVVPCALEKTNIQPVWIGPLGWKPL
jgi:hypothetical protein